MHIFEKESYLLDVDVFYFFLQVAVVYIATLSHIDLSNSPTIIGMC